MSTSGMRQREPPHPVSHLCYSSPVPIRCPCAGLGAGVIGQHFVPAPPAPCGTRSTEAAEGGSGGAGYAVAMTALIAAKSATTRVRSISFFTPSPFHGLPVLSAPGTYLRMRPREGRSLGTHGDGPPLLRISQTARGPSIFHPVVDGPLLLPERAISKVGTGESSTPAPGPGATLSPVGRGSRTL